MAKHTQNKWRVDDSEEDRICVRDEDGGLIADCTDGFYGDDGEWVMAADAAPNAARIAAVPLMLEALEAAILARAWFEGNPEGALAEIEQRARAALAAALPHPTK